MSIIDYIFPKQCINCNRIGYDICTDCIKGLTRTLPTCCICKKLNNGYTTHEKCLERRIQCFTGWYPTRDILYSLDKKSKLGIYSVHIHLLKDLINYLDIQEILENSRILPILTEKKERNRINISLVNTLISNKKSKNTIYIGVSLKDIEKKIGLYTQEPYNLQFLVLFEDINLLPQSQ